MADHKADNITWHHGEITAEQRTENMGHHGATVWLTGLSGSGKSTVAVAAEKLLIAQGYHVYRLDGDNIRHGLCKDLGFSPEDRTENIRRIAEVARLFADSGMICLCSFISPYAHMRQAVRDIHDDSQTNFLEVHVHVPLEVAEQRDPKGLYAKARAGEIKNFTGIDDPFEAPESPELVLHTHEHTIEQSAKRLIQMLRDQGILPD